MKHAKKWVSWSIAIAIWLLPFATSAKFIDTGLLLHQLLITLLAVVLWGIIFRYRKSIRLIRPNVLYLAFAFLFCYVISAYQALNLKESIYWISKIASYIMLFSSFWVLKENELFDWKLIRRSLIGFALIAVIAFWLEVYFIHLQGISLLHEKNLYQINTLFGNKNLYASLMFLTLILLTPVTINDKNIFRVPALIVMLLITTSILFIQTKAVLLGTLVAGLCCLLPILRMSYHRYKVITLMAIASIGMAFLVAGLYVYTHTDKFYVLLNQDTFNERRLIWVNTRMMIKDHFITGVGGGNWQIFFPKYGLEKFISTNHMINDGFLTFQRPHNDFLWIWSEAGLFAILIYAGLFLSGLISLWKRIHTAGLKTKKNIRLILLLFGWIAYIIIASFDFPLERSEHQFLFLLITVQVFGRTSEAKRSLHSFVPVIYIFIGLCSVYVISMRMISDKHAKRILMYQNAGEWDKLLIEFPKANQPFYNLDNFSIPVSWYAGIAHTALNQEREALTCFKEAYFVNPYQLHVLNNLAGTYERLGIHALAVHYYDEALKISSKQPDVRLNRAAALYNAGELDSAYSAIINFPYHIENTQSHLYLKVILKDYLQAKIAANDSTINRAFAERLVQYPDSIQYYYLYFSENKINFHLQLHSPE